MHFELLTVTLGLNIFLILFSGDLNKCTENQAAAQVIFLLLLFVFTKIIVSHSIYWDFPESEFREQFSSFRTAPNERQSKINKHTCAALFLQIRQTEIKS
jgi:hypothetical protein